MVQRSGDLGGWRRNRVESHLQTIPRRRSLDHPPWSKVVQPGPRWSRVVHSQPSEQRGGAWLGEPRDQTAARANGAPRYSASIAPGLRRSAAQRRAERAVDHLGEGWSRGVVQGGPVWSSVVQRVQAARSRGGPAQHPGMVCKRCARRFRVDYSIASADWLARGKVQLCGPPPGLPLRENF